MGQEEKGKQWERMWEDKVVLMGEDILQRRGSGRMKGGMAGAEVVIGWDASVLE